MQVEQKYLTDNDGNVISPITHPESVIDANGRNLINLFYPIGSFFTTDETNNPIDPNTLFPRNSLGN